MLNDQIKIKVNELINNNELVVMKDGDSIRFGQYVVTPATLLKLTAVDNSSSTTAAYTDGDKAIFTDQLNGSIINTIWTSDGKGEINYGLDKYKVYMLGDANNATEEYKVWLNYPKYYDQCTSEIPSMASMVYGADTLLVELISASHSAATIKISRFNDEGILQFSDTQEINEGQLGTLLSYIPVNVISADESNTRLTAKISVGDATNPERRVFVLSSSW